MSDQPKQSTTDQPTRDEIRRAQEHARELAAKESNTFKPAQHEKAPNPLPKTSEGTDFYAIEGDKTPPHPTEVSYGVASPCGYGNLGLSSKEAIKDMALGLGGIDTAVFHIARAMGSFNHPDSAHQAMRVFDKLQDAKAGILESGDDIKSWESRR